MTKAAILLRVAFTTALVNLSNLSTVAANDLVPLEHAIFADFLTSELYSGGSSSNECSSSLGVSMAFSLVYPAASGESEVQIREVLKYPSNSQSQGLIWEDTTTDITSVNNGECIKYAYNKKCSVFAPTIKIANRVYVNNNIELNSTYAESIGEFVESLEFSASDAGEQINKWVEISTNGLIDSIIAGGSIPESITLIAINSIYLKAGWLKKFKPGFTTQESFYTTPSRSTALDQQVHFMHQVSAFDYSETALKGFQVLKLPLAGSVTLSMILVLPFGGDGEVTEVGSKDVLEALPLLENTDVAVGIPKFEFHSEYEVKLKEALQTLGVTAPFGGGLCIEEGSCNSAIDKVIQKTFIGVDEEGVEAAAVTAITMMKSIINFGPNESKLFLADHPMQFFIYDEKENLVFFEGRIGNPVIPTGSTAESSQHTEDDFWSSKFQTTVALPKSSTPADDSDSLLTKADQAVEVVGNTGTDMPNTKIDTGTDMTGTKMDMDMDMDMNMEAKAELFCAIDCSSSPDDPCGDLKAQTPTCTEMGVERKLVGCSLQVCKKACAGIDASLPMAIAKEGVYCFPGKEGMSMYKDEDVAEISAISQGCKGSHKMSDDYTIGAMHGTCGSSYQEEGVTFGEITSATNMKEIAGNMTVASDKQNDDTSSSSSSFSSAFLLQKAAMIMLASTLFVSLI